MKLFSLLIMVGMLPTKQSAPTVSFVKSKVQLVEVFKQIHRQTGYSIMWNEKIIDVTALVEANFKSATIETVLNRCLRNLNVNYSINDKAIAVFLKDLTKSKLPK